MMFNVDLAPSISIGMVVYLQNMQVFAFAWVPLRKQEKKEHKQIIFEWTIRKVSKGFGFKEYVCLWRNGYVWKK